MQGFTKKDSGGFTLIELSIVLVIMGLMLTVAAGLMISLTQKSKISTERKQLESIENALIAYALTRGRLPQALVGPPDCPPGEGCLDYMELGLSTADRDSWGQPYQYAVSERLTQTTSIQNLCGVLYQLSRLSLSTSICSAGTAVCVTNTNDTSDGGEIDPPSSGYHIAAYISSRGEDRESSGKNSNNNFEYEMASNPYHAKYRDDLVQELTFAELSTKICHARNTVIMVTPVFRTGTVFWGRIAPGECFSLREGQAISVALGQTLELFNDDQCNHSIGHHNFAYLALCDATGNSGSCPPLDPRFNAGALFDAKVEVNLP